MLRRFALFLTLFQSILFLAHFFLFETLRQAFGPFRAQSSLALAVVLAVLSISFLGTSIIAFRFWNLPIRVLYIISAAWLGTFNYLFMAAALWWFVHFAAALASISLSASTLGLALFATALALSLFGVINASVPRLKRISITLKGLPPAWRGRTLVLVSDLHLGHVRAARFARRIVRLINNQHPDLILIAGDLFDGIAIDAHKVALPFRELRAKFGAYFSTGNHETIRNPREFLDAIASVGIRILDKENLDLDGLQLLGVPYLDATHDDHLRSVLAKLEIDRSRASILICHAPDRPAIAEEAGISLQLSGHTHGGQFFPHTWFAYRIYRQFVHGLSRLGDLQIFTSYGAGTWGPPLRVGTYPEIVLIRLESA
jgi:predicted MPP superfamily phosphohydrolase